MSMNSGCCLVCDLCGFKLEKLRRVDLPRVPLAMGWRMGQAEHLCPKCAKTEGPTNG